MYSTFLREDALSQLETSAQSSRVGFQQSHDSTSDPGQHERSSRSHPQSSNEQEHTVLLAWINWNVAIFDHLLQELRSPIWSFHGTHDYEVISNLIAMAKTDHFLLVIRFHGLRLLRHCLRLILRSRNRAHLLYYAIR